MKYLLDWTYNVYRAEHFLISWQQAASGRIYAIIFPVPNVLGFGQYIFKIWLEII